MLYTDQLSIPNCRQVRTNYDPAGNVIVYSGRLRLFELAFGGFDEGWASERVVSSGRSYVIVGIRNSGLQSRVEVIFFVRCAGYTQAKGDNDLSRVQIGKAAYRSVDIL
jgi:hypothetical protein